MSVYMSACEQPTSCVKIPRTSTIAYCVPNCAACYVVINKFPAS